MIALECHVELLSWCCQLPVRFKQEVSADAQGHFCHQMKMTLKQLMPAHAVSVVDSRKRTATATTLNRQTLSIC